MFTRTQFHTPDIAEQGRILARVAELVDSGKVKTTMTTRLQGINAATLRKATEMVEQGHMIGKVVVEADAW
jgi:NADPH:quinone reductase-like Zn-dependent oxidoreductase